MDYALTGKTALVGAASAGIGLACARALACERARVVMVARREAELSRAAAEIAAATGVQAIPIPADLSDPDQIERLLRNVRERDLAIDVLVVNTGGPRLGGFLDMSEADWDGAYHLLLRSAILLVRGCLPAMLERGWGRVVGITSILAREPSENLILSNVFRAGVTALFRTLSREVAARGVTVNTVLPGTTLTARIMPGTEQMAREAGISLEEALRRRADALPRRKITDPDEVGAAVAFLASEAASAVNGVALSVDGGQFRGLI